MLEVLQKFPFSRLREMKRDSVLMKRFEHRATIAYSRSSKMYLKEKGCTSDMEKALIMDLGQWMDRAERKMSLSDSYTIDFLILK